MWIGKPLCLDVDIALLEDEVRANHALPDVLNVVGDGLEVRCGVVGTSDIDVVIGARRRRGIQW